MKTRIGSRCGVFITAALFFVLFPARAQVQWSALLDQQVAFGPTNYSLRGVALSADGGSVYATWLHTGADKLIGRYDALTGRLLSSTTMPAGTSSNHGKSIATDDRGLVYIGSGDSFTPTVVQIRSADLMTLHGWASTTDTETRNKRVGGASVRRDGNTYQLYITRESGYESAYIQRFDVTNPAQPVLDTTFGMSGTFNLKSLVPDAGALRGLTVADDGTMYIASTPTSSAADKTNSRVYRVTADLGQVTFTDVRGAMDVVLHGCNVLVSQYDAANSMVAILDRQNLTLTALMDTGFIHSNPSADSGYSGIDINGSGNVYLADQLYMTGIFADRLLVSSALPVFDGIPPTIVCPPNIVIDAAALAGAVTSFSAQASDNCGPVTVSCSVQSGSTVPIGFWIVTCTAMDLAGNTNSCTFTITIRGPRPIKLDVLAQVVEIRSSVTDANLQRLLDRAIGRLNTSLAGNLWVDDLNLSVSLGVEVFNYTRQAVLDLEDAFRLSPAMSAVIRPQIAREVVAARILVENALQFSTPTQLARALPELQLGDQSWAAGNAADAILYYRNAWRLAVR